MKAERCMLPLLQAVMLAREHAGRMCGVGVWPALDGRCPPSDDLARVCGYRDVA